jgi:tetratricopeptide (TPR) repeat protein
MENAMVCYCCYLGKLLCPTALSAFYPHPGYWPTAAVLCYAVFVTAITILAVAQRRRCPYMFVGWLWFIGALVPVIGLIQVGVQAMADRYTYLPSIGLFIWLVWGAHRLACCWRLQDTILSVAAGFLILLCTGMTLLQISYWKDSETLFRHALAVTRDNDVMHYNLGLVLFRNEQVNEAITHFQQAVEIRPTYFNAHINLGVALLKTGQAELGTSHLKEAVRLAPRDADAHYDLALSLSGQERLDEAVGEFREAVTLNPGFAQAHAQLGRALLKLGLPDEAMAHFYRAVQIAPRLAMAQSDLGTLLLQKAQVEEAIAHYRSALETQPNNAFFLNNLAWVMATCAKPEFRDGPTAVALAQQAARLSESRNPAILGTLAAAYAEVGRFPEALATAQRALDLAALQTNSAQAKSLRANITLYQTGSPLREAAQTNSSVTPDLH